MRAKTKTSNIVGGLTLFLILLLLGYIPFSSSRIATICESNSTLLDNATLTDFLAEEHNFFEKSVREGRYELLQAGVPFRDVMHGLPRDGTSLQANKKNVTKAIMDQVARLDQLAEQKDSTITIILWILTLQVSTFFIAVFHVLVVGRLLGGWFSPENIVFKRLPYWCRNIASHVATNATSILLTLGIGGTFLGLMIGLNESMAGSLSEFNIRALFLGLKISFVSTLAGIILSI